MRNHGFDATSALACGARENSVVSALVGIAIEQGYVEGVGQPVLDLYAGRTVAHMDRDKEAMTLEDDFHPGGQVIHIAARQP